MIGQPERRYTCDRCRTRLTQSEQPKGWAAMVRIRPVLGSFESDDLTRFDLCDGCVRSFQSWIDGYAAPEDFGQQMAARG